MRQARIGQAWLLISAIAGASITAGPDDGLTVTEDDITFKIDLFDGLVNPYRVSFTLDYIRSVYRFGETGRIVSLKAGPSRYFFSTTGGAQSDEDTAGSDSPEEGESGVRMLVATQRGEAPPRKRAGFRRRRLWLGCAECEETVDTLCSVSLDDVCFVRNNLSGLFSEDGQASLNPMCDSFGAACEQSAAEICEGFCIEGERCAGLQRRAMSRL